MGGQITASQFYNISQDKLDRANIKMDELGLEIIEYNSDDVLQVGDILVTTEHIEIYVGNGKVFSCGSTNLMQSLECEKSIYAGSGSKIIRVK